MRQLSLLLAGLLAICAPSALAQGDAPEAAVVAVQDVPADEPIEDRLRGILGALGLDGVTASVEAGVVTLSGEVADPAAGIEAADIAGRLEGVVAVRNELAGAEDLSQQLDPVLVRFRTRAEQVVARLPLLILSAAVFAAIVVAGLLLGRMTLWDRLAPNAFIAGLYRQATRVACVIAGIVVALDLLGATALLGTILGAAGIVGLAIGFAVRDTVENFVASIMLSLRQPFRPNDLVEIEGDTGQVIRLTSRATILLSLDGNHIRIPNSVVFKGRIVNYTRNPARRFTFDIGIDPAADLEATRQLAEDTLKALPFVLPDPLALVWVENLTEAGAILRITGWIDQNETGFATARGDAIRLVKSAIEASGVTIPDTTYRIRLESADALPTASAPPEASKSTQPAEPNAQLSRHSEEKALTPMVAAERRKMRDLLSGDAPQE